MPMNRRAAIQRFIWVGAGIALLPSCLHTDSPASVQLSHLKVSGDQEQLLATLGSTIIPTTSTPGAVEVGAHLFVLKMVNDCFAQADREKWSTGLVQFEELSKKQNDTSFVKATPAQRASMLTSLEQANTGKGALSFFYQASKHLIIQAYTSSEYYLTKVQVYELVPGRFKGCVPVKAPVKKIA